MIHNLIVRNAKKTPIAHWPTVPFLKRGSFEFHPGVNVIFGPNGSGKSTLLAALATLMHCKDESWPIVTKASVTKFMRATGQTADGLLLSHDGTPARYLGIENELPFAPETGVKEVDVDLTVKTKTNALDRVSAGQATLLKLIRFLRAEPQKVRYKLSAKKLDDEWKEIFDVATESLNNVAILPGKAKQQVLLLDEIDRSLDFARQSAVWKQIRTLAAGGKHQIIVASHSPFALNVPGAHYIETKTGYLDQNRAALRVLMTEAM